MSHVHTVYPNDLPTEEIFKLIGQAIGGNLDKQLAAKTLWESAGYLLQKYVGEPAHPLILQMQATPVPTTQQIQAQMVGAPPWLRLVLDLLVKLLT